MNMDAVGKNILAIITARGGSKRLPRKNLLPLRGKPLILHTIEAAKKTPAIRRCIVSTEDAEIKEISLRSGAEVIDRPMILANDNSLSSDTVRHVLELLRIRGEMPEYFVLLQPTSPLRTAVHLTLCIEQYLKSGAACAISVVEVEHHPYKCFTLDGKFLSPFAYEKSLEIPRQALPRVYRQNGAIYIMPAELFLKKGCFYASPAMPFIMETKDSIDIDTLLDFRLAKIIVEKE